MFCDWRYPGNVVELGRDVLRLKSGVLSKTYKNVQHTLALALVLASAAVAGHFDQLAVATIAKRLTMLCFAFDQ